MTRFAALLLCMTFLLAPASATKQLAPQLFEDFSYTDKTELKNHGWIVRTEAGWPGIPGATWWDEGVSILKDPDNRNNWILRMTSSTVASDCCVGSRNCGSGSSSRPWYMASIRDRTSGATSDEQQLPEIDCPGDDDDDEADADTTASRIMRANAITASTAARFSLGRKNVARSPGEPPANLSPRCRIRATSRSEPPWPRRSI